MAPVQPTRAPAQDEGPQRTPSSPQSSSNLQDLAPDEVEALSNARRAAEFHQRGGRPQNPIAPSRSSSSQRVSNERNPTKPTSQAQNLLTLLRQSRSPPGESQPARRPSTVSLGAQQLGPGLGEVWSTGSGITRDGQHYTYTDYEQILDPNYRYRNSSRTPTSRTRPPFLLGERTDDSNRDPESHPATHRSLSSHRRQSQEQLEPVDRDKTPTPSSFCRASAAVRPAETSQKVPFIDFDEPEESSPRLIVLSPDSKRAWAARVKQLRTPRESQPSSTPLTGHFFLSSSKPDTPHPLTSFQSKARVTPVNPDLAQPKPICQSSFGFLASDQLEVPSSTMATVGTSSQSQPPSMSPGSSPRLPSPPPFTEVQIGPKSPTIGDGPGDKDQMFDASTRPDDGASRRIRPGTKTADMASGPPLVPLSELNSPFQLQEHLAALYYHHTRVRSHTPPITREIAMQLCEPPKGVDRPPWLYELCRLMVMKANDLIVAFFSESPPCSAQTCPEMRASEWQYLCAVHDPPKSCCAIDYCCHTLDWASNILTSPKLFPSRAIFGSGETGGAQAGMRHLTNIFRRVYRIFAHAWFQHRGVFWQVEGKEGLYVFFKTICDMYQLIPEDNYTIPTEAEGEINIETPIEPREDDQGRMSTLEPQNGETEEFPAVSQAIEEGDATTTISTGATTRRHKHTPSTGSFVTTITESNEEEESGGAGDTPKEGEKDNTPVEAKPKVDEKTEEASVGIKEEEIEKGVASLQIDEKEGVEVPDTAETSVVKADEEGEKVGDVSAEDSTSVPPASEAKTTDQADAEKDGAVTSSEI